VKKIEISLFNIITHTTKCLSLLRSCTQPADIQTKPKHLPSFKL